ncbi:MAG: TSUP family transporter [Gammaproteobacteria bacterium]
MEFTLYRFAATVIIITIGAVLQASTGFGAGLVVVPLLALISLDLVPGPVIFASLMLSSLMTYTGRRDIKRAHLREVIVGLLIGMVAGIVSLSLLPQAKLGLAFGMLVLLAVLVSWLGVGMRLTPVNSIMAGALSGFMGMTAAIGAPVLALLYQHEEGKALRATLALLYLLSSIGMVMLLHLAGRFSTHELVLGIYLMPGCILGYFLAGRIARFVDQGYSRIAVLVISSASALVLILKG